MAEAIHTTIAPTFAQRALAYLATGTLPPIRGFLWPNPDRPWSPPPEQPAEPWRPGSAALVGFALVNALGAFSIGVIIGGVL
ncbi:hypothetical protein E0493_05380 [Roseomonas sp. M0104]|uniref:Uncharacterized protein n=1 Tax=Teichococcus coralli TaxID=2545983 RepID=A0A845B6F2_9PROT|nr:hypothetical protein [Pseudoroseomonas coralli]MXP62781.1 hypothetical protein [Pseudoroseomonas coralli]